LERHNSGKLPSRIRNVLLGQPLRNDQMSSEKLSVFWGLPIMASDAVSSVAYAIEEILIVLAIVGTLAFRSSLLVVLPILVLLGILVFVYSQIIKQHPNGGGVYLVTKENFGITLSLLSSATLIIAYVLTVAVSVSSAAEALTSAFPSLDQYRILICLVGVALLTLINLRGVGESAKIFGVPTYIFILLIVVMLATGFVRLITGGISPVQYDETQIIHDTSQGIQNAVGSLSLLLFLKAFSSGCSALTGVEAISNAVPLFKDPSKRTAIRVLMLLGVIILVVFGGTTLLNSIVHIMPMEAGAANYQTVLSLLARRVFGGTGITGDVLYYALQGFTTLILLLAANTAYSGLPTLLSILAGDSYIPRQFAHRGAKLSFSNGILFLWLAASLLVLLFHAETHRMIPLYAEGVFIVFTLSQAGMLIFFIRTKPANWIQKAAVNAVGMIITATGGVTAAIVRFADGVWILFVSIPVFMLVMHSIHKRYQELAGELDEKEFHRIYKPGSPKNGNQKMIVLMGRLTRSGVKLLNYANSLSNNVTVVSVVEEKKTEKDLRRLWKEWKIDVKLVVLHAPFREIVPPISEYISKLENDLAEGENITVLLTKVIDRRWYGPLLHNQSSLFIQRELDHHRDVVTIRVPYIHD
jgi:amino acid transporter